MELASTTALKKGIPNLRINYTPHPITDQPADMCRKFLEGNDPHTGKPLLDGIIASISKPLTKEEKKRGFLKRDPRPRFLPSDTEDNLQTYFMENNYTDGGPVILPTEERVARMLEGTSHDPEEIVGTMRPSPPHEAWEYTVEMVAVNAVMAGAKPEYFPIILAIASTGTSSLFSSTSSFARMVVVNGPIIEEVDMNPGIGAMGPFNRANTTIGRAWTLISKNLGGSGKPGETFLGTLGNPLSYNNMCFPENEEALPEGWKPFHVQKGFKKSDSVISVFSGWSYTNIAWYSNLRNQDVMKNWLTHFFSFGTGAATFMIDPVTLGYVYADGFDTKEKLASYLAKNSGTPAWLYWQRRERQIEMGKKGTEPFASYLKMGDNAVIPESRFIRTPRRTEQNNDFFPEESGRAFLRDTVEVENSLEILVVGGGTNTYWGGGDFSYMSSANVDKWR